MRLYEIEQQIENVLNQYAEAVDDNGELIYEVDDLDGKLAKLQIDRTEKLINCALYIKNKRAEAEAIKEEEKRLAARRKSLEKSIARTESLIELYAKGEKITDARAAISWRKSVSVEISVPVEKLPQEFQRVKTEISADKTALKEYLKENTLDGVVLLENQNLQIK